MQQQQRWRLRLPSAVGIGIGQTFSRGGGWSSVGFACGTMSAKGVLGCRRGSMRGRIVLWFVEVM